MTPSFKNWTIFVLTLIVLTGIFFAGWFTFAKTHPPPVFTSSHTVVYDTAKKHIYHIWPWYTEKLVSKTYRDKAWIDSIMKANQVDSAGILEQFYSTSQYFRMIADIDSVTKDTSLVVKWTDAITQNKAMPVNGFDYKYIRPTYITENIDNSVNYAKYIYAAGQLMYPDPKWSSVSLFYASRRTLFGVGYIPLQNGVSLTLGTTIAKFK